MGLTDYENLVVDWLYFAFGSLSLVCSLITVFVVYKMNTWNGYLLIMVTTTICQMCYDINFLLALDDSFASCQAWHFLDVFGGLSVSLWTNVLSFVILFILVNIRSVDIFKHFKYYVIVAIVLPFILATLTVTIPGVLVMPCKYADNLSGNILHNLYYWGRIVTILINIVIFIFIYRKLNSMSINGSALKNFTRGTTDLATYPESELKGLAIYTLVSRLKYYPMMQVICRAGAAWNEFDDYKYESFESAIAGAISSPSTGFCYFVVFLILQPKAYETLINLFCCCCKSIFISTESVLGQENPNSSQENKSKMPSFLPMKLWSEKKLEDIIDHNLDNSANSNMRLTELLDTFQNSEFRASRISTSSAIYTSDGGQAQSPLFPDSTL